MIELYIEGPPLAKVRHRTGNGVTYNPQSKIEEAVKWEIKAQLPSGFKPFTGACRIELTAFFSRPKSHYGTGKNSSKLKKNAPAFPTVKPDVDNILKFYADAMNGIVYLDDKQVTVVSMSKLYGKPRVLIAIKEVTVTL